MDSTAFIKVHNAPGLCSRTSVIFSGVFPDRYSARYSMLLLHMLAIVIHILGPPSHRWQKQAPNQLEVGAVTTPPFQSHAYQYCIIDYGIQYLNFMNIKYMFSSLNFNSPTNSGPIIVDPWEAQQYKKWSKMNCLKFAHP